jgi:hypothetical protein
MTKVCLSLEVTDADVQEILFSLALRYMQCKHYTLRHGILKLAANISQHIGPQLGWPADKIEKQFARILHPMKKVTLTCYDVNPDPAP